MEDGKGEEAKQGTSAVLCTIHGYFHMNFHIVLIEIIRIFVNLHENNIYVVCRVAHSHTQLSHIRAS